MSKAVFGLGFAAGIGAAVIFTNSLAGADRYKINKDCGGGGVGLSRLPSDQYRCNGDLADKPNTVLITADEVDVMVQGARTYCDAQVAKAKADVIKVVEAQKAELLKQLGSAKAKP